MINPYEILEARLSNIENLLLDLKHNPKHNGVTLPESDQLLNIQQASVLLNLALPTIYGLCSNRKLPFMKLGKKLYFSKGELTEFIKSGRRKTMLEIEEEAVKHLKKNNQK